MSDPVCAHCLNDNQDQIEPVVLQVIASDIWWCKDGFGCMLETKEVEDEQTD